MSTILPDSIDHFKVEHSPNGSLADLNGNMYGTLDAPITVVNANIPPSVVTGNPPLGHFFDPAIPSPTLYYRLTGYTVNGDEIPFNVGLRSSNQPTWVKRFGSSGTDYGMAVTVNAAGEIFVTGIFSGSVDFGGTILTTTAGHQGTYVAKYSTLGNLIWAKGFSGTASEAVRAIALDPSGNIFISGDFVTHSLKKLDASGNLLWTKIALPTQFPNFVTAIAIASDSAGNVVVTGSFKSLYPGIDFGDGHVLYSQQNSTDTYMAKYSASSGTCLWAKNFVNSGDTEFPTGITVDKSNNKIYITGYAFSGVDLGGGIMSNGEYGAYGWMGVFDTNGGYLLQRSYGTKAVGSTSAPYCRSGNIALDGAGNVIVAGAFNGLVDLGGGYVNNTGTCIIKFTTSSLTYVSAALLFGSGVSGVLTVDSSNNIYVTGAFTSSVVLGTITLLTTSGFDHDIFAAKYAPTLSNTVTPIWAKRYGSPDTNSSDSGTSIVVDAAGFPVITGSFDGTANFGNTSLTSAGSLDIFLMRLNGNTGLP